VIRCHTPNNFEDNDNLGEATLLLQDARRIADDMEGRRGSVDKVDEPSGGFRLWGMHHYVQSSRRSPEIR
jgi:hypothetical protein